MSKRSAGEIETAEQAYLKRQKLSNSTTSRDIPTTIEISSAEQLQQLLTFSQDSVRSSNSIQLFKLFLDSVVAAENNTNKITILNNFLNSKNISNNDGEHEIFLPELMQIWSFASQSNDERLLSAVSAVLALLLRVLSNSLDLSPLGIKLGKTLLLKDQQELIARGLLASKNKVFLISPTLRLLKELVIFDAGKLANNVFRARNQTFKGLIRNLSLSSDGEESLRKPSVRTNAVRFILQLIKYLPIDSKKDLLNQRDIISALTRDIKDDPPFLIRDILEVLKTHIVTDDKLPRESKTKILTATLLGRIAALYRYHQQEESSDIGIVKIQDLAHDFLLFTCTSPNLGALLSQTGLYPKGLDPDDTTTIDSSNDRIINLGLDAIEWIDKYAEKIPVRNTILCDLAKTLRPWSSVKQSELVLSILRAAPELVAEYFISKKDFSFDPKPTATWIGYAAFIFSAVQMPLPKYFGYNEKYANLPPPIPIVIEHVLPQPINQKVLIKCLNQSSNPLIVFFTVKILCCALKKLQSILQMYQEASSGRFSSMWIQAASKITEKFTERFPPISQIITAYRRAGTTDLIQREIFTKLLALYYEVLPCSAMEINSGAPTAISKALLTIEGMSLASPDSTLRALEFENLFSFAIGSPGMKWFSRSKGQPMSPFFAMLRLEALAPPEIPLVRLKSVLASLVEENQLLQTQTAISALDYFIINLRSMMVDNKLDNFYEFIDVCISRCAATPTRYIFKLEEILSKSNSSSGSKSPVSLLTLTMLEQWPHHVKTVQTSALHLTATFIAKHLATSIKIKENKKVIKTLIQLFISDCPTDSELQRIIGGSLELVDGIMLIESESDSLDQNPLPIKEDPLLPATAVNEMKPQIENHNALTKWINKDPEEVILDGYAASLVLLLSSSHLSIRKEASTNISKLAQKLKESTLEEKDQIWLLLTELNETAKPIIDREPLPTVLSVFGSHAIAVLSDPSHYLFPKINKFLLQGPVWQVNKIPLFHSIIDQAPSLDGAILAERKWLLNYLYLGLQSPADLTLYHRRSVFEKLLSTYNANLSSNCREKILKILERACTIVGGSTTLITRFGAVTWLEVQEALMSGSDFTTLPHDILRACDAERIKTWSRDTIKVK